MNAGTLWIEMATNLARVASDMQKTKEIVGGAMKDVEGAVNTAKKALAALGVGLSVGYFVSLIKGSIDAADRLDELSKVTNINVQDLAGLGLAAKQSGGDLESIASSINKLAVNMGKEPEKFRQLGITAKEPVEAFKQLSDLYVALQDPQQRAAVMAEAVGKAWQGSAPLLAEGGKKIGEIIEKGGRLSGVNADMARSANEFNDRMAELNLTLGATRMKLVGDMLPGMNDIAMAMQEAAKEGGLLLTVWVGLGGAMANLLGLTDAQKTAKRIREISDELDIARKQLQAGTLAPGGKSQAGFWSFLIPDIKIGEDAKNKLRATIDELEKERERLSPTAKPIVKKDGADEAAIASVIAEAKAKQFLKSKADKEGYEARIAAIRGFAKTYAEEIKMQSTLADLAFKEGGINNQRTQEELIRRQGELNEKRLQSELASFKKQKAEADAMKNQKDSAVNAEAIIRTNAEIVANETITQARIRAERTITAQQQEAQYNAWLAGLASEGEALANSFGTEREIIDREYARKLEKLQAYFSTKQELTERDNALVVRLETERQAALGDLFAQGALERIKFDAMTWDMQAQTVAGAVKGITQSVANQSKEMFEINRLAALADITVSTSQGVMKAWGQGGMFGIGMAALIAAAGAINFAKVASTKYGGAGGVAPSVSAAAGGAQPVFQVPTSGASGGAGKVEVTVNVITHGNIIGNDGIQQLVNDNVIPALGDAINNRDMIIIGPNSRQAAELVT